MYLKDSDSCGTEELYVLYGITTANGGVSFTQSAPICTPSELHWYGEGSWHLFDYTGDGRDDLFVRGGSSWMVFPSQGRNGNANFVTSQNLIAGLSPAIPAQNGTGDQVQIADLNGDGLTDIVYPSGGVLRARLMERQSGGYGWGTERTVVFDGVDTTGWQINDPNCQSSEYSCWFEMAGVPSSKTGFSHLADFNGDAASDLVIGVVQHVQYEGWCEPPPCPGCEPQSLPVRVSRGLSDGPRTAAYGTEAEVAALNRCQGSRVVRQTHAMSVSAVSPTQITLTSVAFISGYPHAISIADANGDGLSDFFYRGTADADWQYRINTGAGMEPPVLLDLLDFEDQTRFVDVNGDGRADVLHPANIGAYKTYNVRYALPSGGYGPEQWLPGGNNTNANAMLCEGYACDHTRKVPIFADFDADGNIDFVSIKMDDNADLLVSRSSSRFAPRDVIVRFTNGLGAETDVYYAPLTNAAVYRRDSGTRNAVNWGRGSAVLDLLAPTYVVARAASSSPNAADITAKAVLHYRYAGAKIQAGGRGFLGFREIVTIDPNQAGGYVTTATTYSQNFPYVGMPIRTIKRAAIGQTYVVSSCLLGIIADSCYATHGAAFPEPVGSWFSDTTHLWEADVDFATTSTYAFNPGNQVPVHVRTMGTDEKTRDPYNGVDTSRVIMSFGYGPYGNVTGTTADTYTGSGGGRS